VILLKCEFSENMELQQLNIYIYVCVFIPLTCLWRVLKPVAGVLLQKLVKCANFRLRLKIYVYYLRLVGY